MSAAAQHTLLINFKEEPIPAQPSFSPQNMSMACESYFKRRYAEQNAAGDREADRQRNANSQGVFTRGHVDVERLQYNNLHDPVAQRRQAFQDYAGRIIQICGGFGSKKDIRSDELGGDLSGANSEEIKYYNDNFLPLYQRWNEWNKQKKAIVAKNEASLEQARTELAKSFLYSLDTIRLVSKDHDSGALACAGKLNIKTSMGTWSKDVTYSVEQTSTESLSLCLVCGSGDSAKLNAGHWRFASFIRSSSSARLRTSRSWAAALSNPDLLSWRTAEPSSRSWPRAAAIL